ncbi:g743 [Coccomyxa elongata]
MSGGLLQLVAYGAQDLYLTGNPQITWWKLVYRRYTNFAIESIPQTFSGNPDFGRRVTCTIARNGDLINRIYLQVTLPALSSIPVSAPSSRVRWVDRVGHALIDSYELLIGGQSIDKQYGEWLEIWTQLSLAPGKLGAYNRMIGHTINMLSDATSSQYTLYIPLQFWFCRNAGLSLPLIALQYHDIKINVQFNPLSALIVQGQGTLISSTGGTLTSSTTSGGTLTSSTTTGTLTSSTLTGPYIDNSPTTTVPSVTPVTYLGSILDAQLYVDYVYLDTDERRRFAQVSHEYLVDQLQYTGPETVSTTSSNTLSLNQPVTSNITLSLNHPVRALIWVVQSSEWVAANVNQTFNYTTSLQDRTSSTTAFDAPVDLNDASGSGPLQLCTLVLNGKQRIDSAVLQLQFLASFFLIDNTPNTSAPAEMFGNLPVPRSGVMTECNRTFSVVDPARPARQKAQMETQHILLLWKTASERLALLLPAMRNLELCRDSFYLARQVFRTHREALSGAFAAISILPDVETVWKSGLLQYQWTSKSGSPRRLLHASILDYVMERLEDKGLTVSLED